MCYFAYLSFEPEQVEFFSFKLQLVSNQSKKRNFFIFNFSFYFYFFYSFEEVLLYVCRSDGVLFE